MSSQENQTKGGVVQKRQKYRSDSEFVIRKRLPPRSGKEEDVYVTNKSNFKGQIAECMKLIERHGFVVLHGLGAALPRTVNLALQVKDNLSEQFVIDVKTATVRITDDIETENDITELTRDNSAVHIRIYKQPDPPK